MAKPKSTGAEAGADDFKEILPMKFAINVGAGFDIPYGSWYKGIFNEYILSGGLFPLTGMTGIGNSFKSTILHFQQQMLIARIRKSKGYGYDTEVNIQLSHLSHMAQRIPEMHNRDIYMDGTYKITDKTHYSGNKYYQKYLQIVDQKKTDKSEMVEYPFVGRDGKLIHFLRPTASLLDSISDFKTDDVMKMEDSTEIGDKEANMLNMRQGLAKYRVMNELAEVNVPAAMYIGVVAHFGEDKPIATGPMAAGPVRKLTTLKSGEKIKGATDRFTYVMHNCFHSLGAKALLNKDTLATLYPRSKRDDMRMESDLMEIQIKNLRSKAGVTGTPQILIASQTDGILPSLTEFHNLRENRNSVEFAFANPGDNQKYALSLCPEVILTRTTVRRLLDKDERLRRAMNITYEMWQMFRLWHHIPEVFLNEEGDMFMPNEMRQILTDKGYDWNMLLMTRGWWTTENSDHPIPFLSSGDLLRMCSGDYHPYWLEEDKKTIKPGFGIDVARLTSTEA